jgi:hypothetical protein
MLELVGELSAFIVIVYDGSEPLRGATFFVIDAASKVKTIATVANSPIVADRNIFCFARI